MYNYQQTVISQYAASPTINQLITSFNGYIDPTANLDLFYNYMWNLATAQGYGLDVWGRIVGVTRVLQVGSITYLGASGPDGTSGDSMDVAPFYNDGVTTTNYLLSDDAFRILIYAKALFNICNGSTAGMNAVVMELFSAYGQAWVIDNGNLTMSYNFDFPLNPVSQAIVSQSGVLPRPAGVAVTYVTNTFTNVFGVLTLPSSAPYYPTSSTGLVAGSVWNSGGAVHVVSGITPNPSAPPVYFGVIGLSGLLSLGGGNLPLTNPGVGTKQLWNNGGVVNVA